MERFFIDTDAILIFIRIVLGATMVFYGWQKVRDLKGNADDFIDMGFKPGFFWGTLIAANEFLGGIAVIIGIYPELAASLFGFQMVTGTIWKFKNKESFTEYSYDLQLLGLCLALIAFGPGYLVIMHDYIAPPINFITAILAVGAAAFFAFMPEIFGKKYQRWKSF